MKKAPRPSHRSSSAGFSSLEALVALLLVAVVGLVALQAVAGGLKAWRAGRARAADSVLLLQLDGALRRAAGAVVVPCWVGSVEAVEAARGFSLPYGGGEVTRSLSIQADNGWIVLETVDGESRSAVRLGPFAEAAVAPLFDQGRLWGVRATVRLREVMDAVELRARIGSRPLPEAAP